MKVAFTILLLICSIQAVQSQRGLPPFGKIGLQDMELSDCFFEPGANAFKLIDWGNIYFTRNTSDLAFFTTMYERRVRIKILKEEGLSYANLTIPFYNDEKIITIAACTYNLIEGNKIKKTIVFKNAIFKRRINKQYSEMVVIFPEVKAGSVIEYKYLTERKTIADIKDWYFQSNMPTQYSECQVSIPSIFHFNIQPITADSLEMKESTYTDRQFVKGNILSAPMSQKNFIMRNLPAIHNEPYMGSVWDYVQRLSFRLAAIDYGNGNVADTPASWEEIATKLINDPDFGKQLNRKLTGFTGIIAVAKNEPSKESRMQFLFNYVKSNLVWNGVESIYSYQGIKKAFENKTGNSADINLLLISLLKESGITAVPVLFSTRDNAAVNPALPFVNQFNTVMALVEAKKKYYILDATDQYSAYDLVPVKIINTKGFVVEAGNGHWLNVIDTIHKYKVVIAVQGAIDTAGIMKGDVLVSSSGYARKQRYKDWMEDKNKFAAAYLKEYSTLQIDDPQIENLEADTLPLEQKLRFSLALNNTGGHQYFKINLFSELEKNRFLAAERYTDIDFCYQQEYNIYGNYTIPPDYIFEDLPQNISLIMPDTSIIFKRFISTDNNLLNMRMSVDFKRSWYSAGEYPGFAAFYKMLISKLNEQVIIKKKDNT